MRKRIVYLMVGGILVSILSAACGNKAIKEEETSSTIAEASSNEEETGTSEITDEATSESEKATEKTTTEKTTTTVKQDETTTTKGEVTTTKKHETATAKQETTTKTQEMTIFLGYDENGEPILITEEEWAYMNSEEYLLANGVSVARNSYTQSADYEMLDYWPEGEYGWSAVDFWWEPVTWMGENGWNNAPLYFEWEVYCNNGKFEDTKGNALEYMSSFPNYEESYHLYTGGKFKFGLNECGKYGTITLYVRKINENPTGYGTKCTLVENDEDLMYLVEEAKEKGLTQIAYYYNEEQFEPKAIYYYYAANDIVPLGEGLDISQDIKIEGSYYNMHIRTLPNDQGDIKICRIIQNSNELKEYINDCVENGVVTRSNIYVQVIGKDCLNGTSLKYELIKEIEEELYHEHGNMFDIVNSECSVLQEGLSEDYDYFEIKIVPAG